MSDIYNFIEAFVQNSKVSTPAYVFDLDKLESHIEGIKKKLEGIAEICFAMKANPFLVGPMKKHVSHFEVCSPGEFRICQRMEVPMKNMVISGVYKKPEDIRQMLCDYGDMGIYTAESKGQLELLNKAAGEQGIILNVLLRVTGGNQFGMDEQTIRELAGQRKDFANVCIRGLQFYSGTQKKIFSQIEEELVYLDNLIEELKDSTGFQAEILEYGPGLNVPYFVRDKGGTPQELLTCLKEALGRLRFSGRLVLEMGRFLTAYCGYYITSVVDKKINNGQSYVILDGGINHLNYYGQTMAMKQPFCRQLTKTGEPPVGREEEKWDLCGALCTAGDVLVRGFSLKEPEAGDILVFERVGAYSVTEGIYLFLSRPLPGIYFWSQREGLYLVREGKNTDILNSEK